MSRSSICYPPGSCNPAQGDIFTKKSLAAAREKINISYFSLFRVLVCYALPQKNIFISEPKNDMIKVV
jgi:hypothetical protein